MLNLRSLNYADTPPPEDSDAQHFSRFSHPMFRHTSVLLGNIGEPLDHGQAERYIRGDDAQPSDGGEAPAAKDSTTHMLDDERETARSETLWGVSQGTDFES